MIQPNVYWTLLTPVVSIIGLYSNVPEHGVLHPDQLAWLVGELKTLPASLPLLVTLHHPPYSADDHHGRIAVDAPACGGDFVFRTTPPFHYPPAA